MSVLREHGDAWPGALRERLRDYPGRWAVETRWADVDMYGHVNNAVYYSLFDTALNAWLAHHARLDLARPPAHGVVAESRCLFMRPVHFPQKLEVGIETLQVGRTSVTYRMGLFVSAEGEEADQPAAICDWVHVYVDPITKQTVPIPEAIRISLRDLA